MRSGWSNPADYLSFPPVKFIFTKSSTRTNKYERWRENSYPCLVISLPIDVPNCRNMFVCGLYSTMSDVKQQRVFTELYVTLRKEAEKTCLILKLCLGIKIIDTAKHKARFQKNLIFCDDKTVAKSPKPCTMTITDKIWYVFYIERQITMCEMTEKPGFHNVFQMILILDVGIRFPAQHQIFKALGFSWIPVQWVQGDSSPWGLQWPFTSNPTTCLHSVHRDNFTFALDLVKILTQWTVILFGHSEIPERGHSFVFRSLRFVWEWHTAHHQMIQRHRAT